MIPIGLIGSTGWSEFMYLPSLKDHPQGKIVAVCGRDRQRAQVAADKWGIPQVYDDYNALIDSGQVEAVIVSTINNTHYPIVMKALNAGLHVLCEKPLAMNYAEAREMADLAAKKGLKTLVPFTWSFMPYARHLKELLEGGYIGTPYHFNMRWYAGFWRNGEYHWRLDKALAGVGAAADFGAHIFHLAYWYFGRIVRVSAQLGYSGSFPKLTPERKSYEQTDTSSIITLEFENGMQGVIHLSMMAYEDTFAGSQVMEFHGSEGTLHCLVDFDKVQQVSGAKVGEGIPHDLPIPDRLWGNARREDVLETIEDVFNHQDVNARLFVSSIASNTPAKPDFQDGAYIQRIIDAVVKSHAERRWIDVNDIQ